MVSYSKNFQEDNNEGGAMSGSLSITPGQNDSGENSGKNKKDNNSLLKL